MTTREPLFTEQDRAELLALSVYRDGLCPSCGRPVEVCTSHEETGPEFVATYSVCRSTLAIAEQQFALAEKSKGKSSPFTAARLWATTIRKR